MKKLLTLLLALVATLCLALGLSACNNTNPVPTKGLEYTLNEDGASYTVTGIGTAIEKDIVIASKYEGKPVTAIGEDAFRACSELTSITIPDSITAIGEMAFLGCNGLISIEVSSKNTTYHSAGNCLIDTKSKTLISGCFNSIIPTDGSVISIGDCAFYYCVGLTEITIPDSVTTIGKDAFHSCTALTKISIGNNVKIIGENAFMACGGLTNIIIPDSVISIGKGAFCGAGYGLISIEVSSDNTTYYSAGNCLIDTKSKTLILGCYNSIIPTDGSVISIGEYAFYGRGVSEIIISDSVTTIGEHAFYVCDELTEITIPNSVNSIEDYAFYGCWSLTSINFKGTMAQWNAIEFGSDWNRDTGIYTVHCTDGDIAK